MYLIIIIYGLFLYSVQGYPSLNKNLTTNRYAKSINNYPSMQNMGRSNEICTTQTGINGLCMRRLECLRAGGSVSGFCGTFGVCCEMNLLCGKISKLKRTIIQSPSILPRRCTYHFQPFSSNVCQLRIDFDIVLAQPTKPEQMMPSDTNAVTCLLDKFEIGDIKLCGANLNQHIYLPFDAANGITDISLLFTLADRIQNPSLVGHWRMIVSQLECPVKSSSTGRQSSYSFLGFNQQNTLNDLTTFLRPPVEDLNSLAPAGCLQYFTENQGSIESFNYNNGVGPYMANMRYGICFKRTTFDKGVQLSGDTFQIGAETDVSNYIDTDCHDILGTPGRSNDYLVISESLLASSTPLYGTYYCGTSLKGTDLMHAPPGPFAIYFSSDNIYSTLVPEIGFKLNYVIVQ